MSITPKVAIIDKDSKYLNDLASCLSNTDYTVVCTCSSIAEGTNLIKLHNPHSLILELALDDGEGIEIIEFISHHIHFFTNLSYIIIFSALIDHSVKNDISEILTNTPITCRYVNKDNDYYPELISNRLNSAKGLFESDRQIPVKSVNPIKSLIYQKLNDIGISKSSKFREYLAFAIEEILIEGLHSFQLNELYETIALSFDCIEDGISLGAIRKGISNVIKSTFEKNPDRAFTAYKGSSEIVSLQKVPTNKIFIKHVANAIRESYPELLD
ncbi:MAG: hypothetical protein FWE07_07635 [Turicibacter sp.]|nr:hypothetical protein [Turicibacter sp.]